MTRTSDRGRAPRTAAPPSGSVQRIHWVPGTDRLLAVCFCRTEREFEDPVQLWDWLLAHPLTDPAAHGSPVPPSRERELT